MTRRKTLPNERSDSYPTAAPIAASQSAEDGAPSPGPRGCGCRARNRARLEENQTTHAGAFGQAWCEYIGSADLAAEGNAFISRSETRRSFNVILPSTWSTAFWSMRHTERIEQSGMFVQNRSTPAWVSQKEGSYSRPPSAARASPTLICSAGRESA